MSEKARESDKLVTVLKSWPIYPCGGVVMAFLTIVLTESYIAALLLCVILFLGALAIIFNNITGTKKGIAWTVLILGVGAGILLWRIKFPPPAPKMPMVKAFDIGFNDDASKITLGLLNSGTADLSSDSNAYLVIVPFEANRILHDRVAWISAERAKGIPSGEPEKLAFNISPVAPRVGLNPASSGINQAIFFIAVVVNEELPRGFWVDVAGYTSKAGRDMAMFSRHNRLTLDDDQKKNVLEYSKHIEEKMKNCLDGKNNNEECFSGD